jgi:Flp pilus assembly protein TadG
MIRLLKRLRDSERGASVIELALVAPVFATLVVGISDVTRAYSMKLRLEEAAQRAIETVQQQSRNGNNYSTLSTEASNAASAAGYSGSTVTVTYSLECNGTSNTSTTGAAINATCNSGQTYARYVTVNISNSYTPMFTASYFPHHNNNGTVTVSGYAGIRVQ